jgi:hypothetical protein
MNYFAASISRDFSNVHESPRRGGSAPLNYYIIGLAPLPGAGDSSAIVKKTRVELLRLDKNFFFNLTALTNNSAEIFVLFVKRSL